MKALTIWQPWASLVVWGEKKLETRGWATRYRGPLAIHAGLGDMTEELIACNRFYAEVFQVRPKNLPHGVVLGIVNVLDCEPINHEFLISSKEEAFGDYSAGRFAWELEVVEVFTAPVPAKGKQGLWEWDRP